MNMSNIPIYKLTEGSLDTVPSNIINDISDGTVNISKAMSEYGPIIVILSSFLFLFSIITVSMIIIAYKMIKKNIDRQNTTETQNRNIINEIIEKALKNNDSSSKKVDEINTELHKIHEMINILKNEKSNKQESNKDIVGAFIDTEMILKDYSKELYNNIKCNRIAIYVFHNGNKSTHGLPFFKMSCIHEYTKYGTNTTRGVNHINMPLHLYDFIENLWTQKVYKISNIEKYLEETNDSSLKDFIAFSSANAIYMIPIYANNETMAGFACIEFETAYAFGTNDNHDTMIENSIESFAQKVSPIISVKTKTE